MQPFLIVGAIAAAIALYWVRCRTRFWYGVVEIAVGILIICLTVYPQTSYLLLEEQSTWRWLSPAAAILAGTYVVIRGLDNIENGLSAGAKAKWDRFFRHRLNQPTP